MLLLFEKLSHAGVDSGSSRYFKGYWTRVNLSIERGGTHQFSMFFFALTVVRSRAVSNKMLIWKLHRTVKTLLGNPQMCNGKRSQKKFHCCNEIKPDGAFSNLLANAKNLCFGKWAYFAKIC